MKFAEVILSELCLSSRGAALTSARAKATPNLRPEVRQAANRGLAVFPVSEFSKMTGQPNFLIGEATSDIFRLEELAAEHPSCIWHAAVGSSRLRVVRLDGKKGRAWFAAKNEDQGDGRTLAATRGDVIWAIFQWPTGLVLRAWAKELAPGVTILTDDASFPLPPFGGCIWVDPWAEIEAIPYWMREVAFESPEAPPGKAVPAPSRSARPVPCRSSARFEPIRGSVHKGHPSCHQSGW